MLRTLQYSARFWAWWLRQNPQVRRPRFDIELFARQCSSSRKISGIGNFVEHLIVAVATYKSSRTSKKDNFLRLLDVCHHLGYAVYLTSDIVLYLNLIEIISNPTAARYQHEACKAWLFGLACSITKGWYTLMALPAENDIVMKPHDDMTRTEVRIQLLSDHCDLLIASTLLGYVKQSDGLVSVSGTISSLTGIWKVWQRTA